MSEGIPLLYVVKIAKAGYLGYFIKWAWVKNAPLKSAGAKDPVSFVETYMQEIISTKCVVALPKNWAEYIP